MSDISFDDLRVRLKSNQLKIHNIYNADLNLPSVLSSKYYRTHTYDNPDKDQVLPTVFIDIEVYTRNAPNQRFDFITGDCPLSAITLYSTSSKSFVSFLLLNDINKESFGITPNMKRDDIIKIVNDVQDSFKKKLIESKHMLDDEILIVHICIDEFDMIKKCWEYIRKEGPVIISGWNCDGFDLPYFYNRICWNWDKETAKSVMSEFNSVELRNGLLKIAEYSIMDLAYAYKPRAEGGMDYGETLASYTLNSVSNHELGLTKHDFDGDLDGLYETDPVEYLFYNIVDVALCSRLNEKLQHLDLHNGIRRRVKSAFTHAMIGSSALFETFIYSQLSDKNEMVRCGVINEDQYKIDKDVLSSLPKLATKKGEIKPDTITARDLVKYTRKFDGAYVTVSSPRVIKGNKLIIDLDAASLYPSMIMQHNISFDSYRARVLPWPCIKLLTFMEKNPTQLLSNGVVNNLKNSFESYVKRESISPQGKSLRDLFYITMYMLKQIQDSRIPIHDIYKGVTDEARTILVKYLLPLTDIINNASEHRQNYNHFIYDYVFGEDDLHIKNHPFVYILKNANSSSKYIDKVTPQEAIEYLSQYSLTLSGVACSKHDEFLGMFTGILSNLKELRTAYRKRAAEFQKGTKEYQLFNNRQASIKVLMNSVYGVYGLSSYRYSNHWLAQAITTQGRLTVKLAQFEAERTMQLKFKEDQ